MRQSAVIQRNWQNLIKPEKLEVEPGADPSRIATIVAEPLERGFGMTLGNAIRRILLSSLQGAAVTAVQIDGVLHEFSSIAGVREDVTDIVLNIKDIAIKMQGEGPKRMVLKKSGPGAVTAGDISFLLLSAGPCTGCPEDLDGDGEVGASDVSFMLLSFGPCN